MSRMDFYVSITRELIDDGLQGFHAVVLVNDGVRPSCRIANGTVYHLGHPVFIMCCKVGMGHDAEVNAKIVPGVRGQDLPLLALQAKHSVEDDLVREIDGLLVNILRHGQTEISHGRRIASHQPGADHLGGLEMAFVERKAVDIECILAVPSFVLVGDALGACNQVVSSQVLIEPTGGVCLKGEIAHVRNDNPVVRREVIASDEVGIVVPAFFVESLWKVGTLAQIDES